MELEHHTRGSLVWVNDSQAGWIKGEVVSLEGSQLRVRTETGGTRLCSPADCPLQNPSSRMGVEVRHCASWALAGIVLASGSLLECVDSTRGGLGCVRGCLLRAPQHPAADVNDYSAPGTSMSGSADRARRDLDWRCTAAQDMTTLS